MLCNACEKFRFPSSDGKNGKDHKPGTLQAVHRKFTDSCLQGLETGKPTAQPAAPDFGQSIDQNNATAYAKIHIANELLTYVKFHRNSASIGLLRKVILNCYTANDIAAAKNMLLVTFPSLADSTYAIGRRDSSSRHQHEAELEDIIGALDFVDNKSLLQGIHFVADNLDRLPKYGPEEVNVCAVVDRHRVLDGQLTDISVRIEALEGAMSRAAEDTDSSTSRANLAQSIQDLESKVSSTLSTLSSRIENSNAALQMFADQINKSRGPPVRSQVEAEHSMNIVINGIAEDKNPQTWKGKVDDVLQFLLHRQVDVADLFRICGRYREGRTRLIIVKL